MKNFWQLKGNPRALWCKATKNGYFFPWHYCSASGDGPRVVSYFNLETYTFLQLLHPARWFSTLLSWSSTKLSWTFLAFCCFPIVVLFFCFCRQSRRSGREATDSDRFGSLDHRHRYSSPAVASDHCPRWSKHKDPFLIGKMRERRLEFFSCWCGLKMMWSSWSL